MDDTLFTGGELVVTNIAEDDRGHLVYPNFKVFRAPLNDRFINIKLDNVLSPFVPSIKIGFRNAAKPTLDIKRELHLVSVKFTAGVDATITLSEM
jgi:hypothetical protein